MKELFKNKKFYLAIFLTLLIGFFIFLHFFLNYSVLTPYREKISKLETNLEELRNKQDEIYTENNAEQILQSYKNNLDKMKVFNSLREKSLISAGEDRDFFPNLTKEILPLIKKQIHKDIVIESITINSLAEVSIPIHGPDYTTVAKQYAAIKQNFEAEKPKFFSEIKMNTFNQNEIEITAKDANNKITKERKKVVKALILARINPEVFKNTEKFDNTYYEEESSYQSQKKKSFFEKVQEMYKNISKNISLAYNNKVFGFDMTDKKVEIKEEAKETETEELKEKADLEEKEKLETKETTEVQEEEEKEEVIKKEILTKEIKTFKLNGQNWSRVPRKMSEFLAAGKKLKVAEDIIDPYETYEEKDLEAKAIKMMQYIIKNSKNNFVSFHNKDFDVSTHEAEVIDLFELNERPN
jgi:hypothetical protein